MCGRGYWWPHLASRWRCSGRAPGRAMHGCLAGGASTFLIVTINPTRPQDQNLNLLADVRRSKESARVTIEFATDSIEAWPTRETDRTIARNFRSHRHRLNAGEVVKSEATEDMVRSRVGSRRERCQLLN